MSSGIDWFELHGSLDFGDGLQVKLPALLSALRRGETMIALGDGSLGLLPQEWLQKYGLLTTLGEVEDDHLRFKQTQTGVLDALLAARPEITCDETFARVRAEWQNFRGISPVAEPPGPGRNPSSPSQSPDDPQRPPPPPSSIQPANGRH